MNILLKNLSILIIVSIFVASAFFTIKTIVNYGRLRGVEECKELVLRVTAEERSKLMGEVRSTLESPTKSPKSALRGIQEQLQDLIDIKNADLKQEGKSMEERNQRSIDQLNKAVEHVKKAVKILEEY